jgi:hypothetical protein
MNADSLEVRPVKKPLRTAREGLREGGSRMLDVWG